MLGQSAGEERLLTHVVAGGAAGALASGVTTPLDVVKTRLQTQVWNSISWLKHRSFLLLFSLALCLWLCDLSKQLVLQNRQIASGGGRPCGFLELLPDRTAD
jgi:hypothetical protein